MIGNWPRDQFRPIVLEALAQPLVKVDERPLTNPVPTLLRGVARLLSTAALVVGLLLAVAFLLLAAVPKSGLYNTFAVLSASMEPAIAQGSVVVVVPVAPVSLRVGDIITYTSAQPPHPTVTHRVLSIAQAPDGLVFRTKGDANLVADPWDVRYAQQAGKVVLAVPYAGFALVALATWAGRAGLAVAVALFLGAGWLRLLWRKPAPTGQPSTVPAVPAPNAAAVEGWPVLRAAILAWLVISLATRGRSRWPRL